MAEKTPKLPQALARAASGRAGLTVRTAEGGEIQIHAKSYSEGRVDHNLGWYDPAELMRNLAAFVPEVGPVGVVDSDGLLWRTDGNGQWSTPTAAFSFTLEKLERDQGPLTEIYAHPPVTAEPAAAPSVEQIEKVLEERACCGSGTCFEHTMDGIRALYVAGGAGEESPGKARGYSDDTLSALATAQSQRERAEKAEARVNELEAEGKGTDIDYAYLQEHAESLSAEVERCKAALEAADELIEAEHAWGQSKLSAQIAIDERIRREHEVAQASAAYSAARAAVEAETSEEAGA